jgi:hypothetical protein
MIERRAFNRLAINRPALLSFDGIRGVHPCVVRDISAFGARISAPYHIFANEFELSFDGVGRIFNCRIVWRKGTVCGVSFVLRRRSSKPANDCIELDNAVRLDRWARIVGAIRKRRDFKR